MAIYNIFENETVEEQGDLFEKDLPLEQEEPIPTKRDRFVSNLVTRLFFFVLLAGDLLWGLYSIVLLLLGTLGSLITLFKVEALESWRAKRVISFKRSLVCSVALFVALFSPSFGIMVACTYFLMYDKAAIDEIVPSSIREQFKQLFQSY